MQQRKCCDCGKVLKDEDKDKTWQELLEGCPACIECDEKLIDRIEEKY